MNKGKKYECKVRPLVGGQLEPGYDGFAHVVEQQYDERFTAWYGAVALQCNASQMIDALNAHRGMLILEDGRMGEINFMGGMGTEAVIIEGLQVGDDYKLVYFV